MQPLGTITKYYPFLEEEVQSALGSLMRESSNYYDFVSRLARHVLDNEVHPHLAHIAASQAFWSHATEMLQDISEKYHEAPYIRIWGISPGAEWRQFEADGLRRSLESELDRVVEHCNEDWIIAELYLFYAFHLTYSPAHKTLETLDKLRALIVRNARLRCFDALACAIEAPRRIRESCFEDVVEILMRGLSIAREFGDIVYELLVMTTLAWAKRDMNIVEAGQLIEEAYALASDIGIPYLIAEVLNDACMVYEMTGQLDLALACQLESFKVVTDGTNDTIPHLILSRIYAKLDNGKKALEHVNLASIDLGDRDYHYFHTRRAHALILMNRLEEAEDDIATAYSQVVRSDIESNLALYYQVCGIYEQAKGNLLNALDFLERAFEIDERLHRVFWGIDTLFYLADVELSIKLQSKDRHEAFPSGPWTTKLETQLRVHNLPGLLMHFALLKARFYQELEQYRDARHVLSDALELSDSDGVRSFRLKIAEKIKELDRLIGRPSA